MKRRSIVIKHKDNSEQEYNVSKAVQIDVPQDMIHLDKLKDGSWRITYSKSLIENFSDVNILIIEKE